MKTAPDGTTGPATRYLVDADQGPGASCAHLDGLRSPAARPPDGCEDCLRGGTEWVHLRECLGCGHVGCCDSSPERHATAHFKATGHPVIASAEPEEDWAWCYPDGVVLVPAAG